METVHDPKTLIYVMDPMCSWCWGFSPVLEELRSQYQERIPFQLMVGGLRPGNTERFDDSRRGHILQHWRTVQERTGQPFNFHFQMGTTFTYDTEPASRAIVVVRQLVPGQEWALLREIQAAFYVENADVTKIQILEGLVVKLGMDGSLFRQAFHDSQTRQAVWEEFDQAREMGVSGFPALLGKQGQAVSTFMYGYQGVAILCPLIDRFLEKVG
jgi:putative protein-disulfide isomerase